MKIIIGQQAFMEILFINSLIHNTEWMGSTVYSISGNSIDKDTTITLLNVFLASEGHPSTVGFKRGSDADMLGITKQLEYSEKGIKAHSGIIHSHHNMSTSFSGLDETQLTTWAKDKPYYLSIVVNNKMEVTAKIGLEKSIKLDSLKVKDFNNKLVDYSSELIYSKIELIDLDVEFDIPEYFQVVADCYDKREKYIPETVHKFGAYPIEWESPYSNHAVKKYNMDNSDSYKNTWGDKHNVNPKVQTVRKVDTQHTVDKSLTPYIKSCLEEYICVPNSSKNIHVNKAFNNILTDSKSTGISPMDFARFIKSDKSLLKNPYLNNLATKIQKEYGYTE